MFKPSLKFKNVDQFILEQCDLFQNLCLNGPRGIKPIVSEGGFDLMIFIYNSTNQ